MLFPLILICVRFQLKKKPAWTDNLKQIVTKTVISSHLHRILRCSSTPLPLHCSHQMTVALAYGKHVSDVRFHVVILNFLQNAAKQAAAAATQTIAAAQHAASSNKNPAAQQQLVQSCKVISCLCRIMTRSKFTEYHNYISRHAFLRSGKPGHIQ